GPLSRDDGRALSRRVPRLGDRARLDLRDLAHAPSPSGAGPLRSRRRRRRQAQPLVRRRADARCVRAEERNALEGNPGERRQGGARAGASRVVLHYANDFLTFEPAVNYVRPPVQRRGEKAVESVSVAADDAAQRRLEELGYTQQLRRRLHVWHVVGLAMADVSPTMAVVFLTAGVFLIGGTFAVGANIILGVVVVLIALCLAELATMYPIAGGMYSLVRRVLPGPISWITMFNYLIQGIVIPASIALGVAGFLKDLIPGLDISTDLLALITLAIATGIALTRVEVGAWVTITMVVVELVVLGIITVAALAHPHQNLGDVVFHPQVLDGKTLEAIGFAAILATIAPAFNVINGYDASLGFSEELKGGERAVAKAVIISAILAAAFIIVPLTASVVAAPNVNDFLSSDAPVVYSVDQSLGSAAKDIVDLGASVALFNAM